jgi:short-subunit dehydrogenase
MTIDHSAQTTLITGASAGIGVEFARELARRGSDLVLVARRKERLDTLAAELEAAHGIAATVVPLDLSLPGAGAAILAETQRQGITITSVINNAGFGLQGPFHEDDAARLADEIMVNISSLVDISRTFIEPLREAETGYLVNIASLAAYFPSPRMAVYAATKAFVLSFTEALWFESRDSGLRVLCVSPGATQTEFFDVAGPAAASGATLQPPAGVVRTALKALDARRSVPSVAVGRGNALAAAAIRLFTRRQTVLVAGRITS